MPEALRERLGLEASVALVEMVDDVGNKWRAEVIEQAVDRVERRLVESFAALRVEMVEGFSTVRQEIGGVRDGLRQETSEVRNEVRQEIGGVRDELRQGIGRLQDELRREGDDRRRDVGSLRQEVGGLRLEMGSLRESIATDRFELLKWTFVFWVGQVFAIGSLVALLLRFVRPVG